MATRSDDMKRNNAVMDQVTSEGATPPAVSDVAQLSSDKKTITFPAASPTWGDIVSMLDGEETPSEGEAATIDVLVDEHEKLAMEIDYLETELKAKRKLLYQLETVRLVDAMRTARRQELVTDNLMELKLNEELIASLPKRDDGKRKGVIEYVRENGGSGSIKNTITVPVQGDNQSVLVKTFLIEQNLPFKEDEDIHPMTFNKFCREKMERDHDLDFDKANAYVRSIVEVKPWTGEKKLKVGKRKV